MKNPKRTLREAASWADLSIIGIQFPVAIVIGYFFGRWLDRQLGTGPWLMAVFCLFGIIAGFINLFRIAAKAEADEGRREREGVGREEDGDHDGV